MCLYGCATFNIIVVVVVITINITYEKKNDDVNETDFATYQNHRDVSWMSDVLMKKTEMVHHSVFHGHDCDCGKNVQRTCSLPPPPWNALSWETVEVGRMTVTGIEPDSSHHEEGFCHDWHCDFGSCCDRPVVNEEICREGAAAAETVNQSAIAIERMPENGENAGQGGPESQSVIWNGS